MNCQRQYTHPSIIIVRMFRIEMGSLIKGTSLKGLQISICSWFLLSVCSGSGSGRTSTTYFTFAISLQIPTFLFITHYCQVNYDQYCPFNQGQSLMVFFCCAYSSGLRLVSRKSVKTAVRMVWHTIYDKEVPTFKSCVQCFNLVLLQFSFLTCFFVFALLYFCLSCLSLYLIVPANHLVSEW